MSGYHLKQLERQTGFELGIDLPPLASRPALTMREKPRYLWEMKEIYAEIGGWIPPMLTLGRQLRVSTARRMLIAQSRLTRIAMLVYTLHSFREIGRELGISHVAVRKAWLKHQSSNFHECVSRGFELMTACEHTRLPPSRDRRRRGALLFNGQVRIPRLPRPGWPLQTFHPGAYSDRRVCSDPVVGWKEGAEFFGWLAPMPYPHWNHLTYEQKFLVTYYLRQKYRRRDGRPVPGFVWEPPGFGPFPQHAS